MVWLVSAATAAEPVVHEGDAEAARATVSEAARLPPGALEPIAVAELRARPPAMVGSGRVWSCGSSPLTREQLLLALTGAEGALTYDDPARVRAELDRVSDVVTCPPPFDADLLARYWVDRALAGDEPERSFAFARALAPSLAASEAWPEAARATFEAAAPLPPVVVKVPHPGVDIDGEPVSGSVSLVPGWHPVSGAGFAGALEVDADATFVVPAATPADLLDDVSTEAGRALPTALLAEAFGEGNRVFVVTNEGVWAATAGRTDWLPLQRRKTHPLVPIGLGTTAAGALGTAITGALAAVAYGAVGAAGDDVARASTADTLLSAEAAFEERADRYRAVRLLPLPFAAVGVVGLGLTGAGLALGPVTVGGGS